MILMPDVDTVVLDPFFEDCNRQHPLRRDRACHHAGYERDPRSIGKRAEAYLKSTASPTARLSAQKRFFIFDSVRWTNEMHTSSYAIDSVQGAWNSNTVYRKATWVTAPASKVATSRFRRLMHIKYS